MDALRSWTLWWLVLFALWVVMQGTNEAMEVAAGAGAAALGAVFAELARRQGLLRFAPEAAWLARSGRIPWRVVREFAVVTRALVLELLRLRRVRSSWVAVPFPAGGDDPVAAGRRAAATLIENVSPNTIAVDIDCERGRALRHDLDPRAANPTSPS
jgi:Na+/H+ ion antiporter subunit